MEFSFLKSDTSWRLIETGQVNNLTLDLYQHESDYMIRVDGLELMNSRWPRSEQAMAKIAKSVSQKSNPRLLIGGLGLGFTLASVLDEFSDGAMISVAEQSSDILRWYQAYFKKMIIRDRDDSKVLFVNQDVRDVILNAQTDFDLILLDVDNGPEPVSGQSNGKLYEPEGLLEIYSKLSSGGALLLWSAFESEAFVATAHEAGFEVNCVPVPVGLRDHQHFIYCALKV